MTTNVRRLLERLLERNAAAEEDDDTFIKRAYRYVLRREVEASGYANWRELLSSGKVDRGTFLDGLVASGEFQQRILFSELGSSLHQSRTQFVRSLPKAGRILDLGGSCQDSEIGALVHLGYPYRFEELTIVDLPVAERHATYARNREVAEVMTPLGPSKYCYQSMAALDNFASASFDMVYSGQTIEHVSEEEADQVCAHAFRVLKPGGYFCLDTPNAKATRLQQEAFIDPDHKFEYTHDLLAAKLRTTGFRINEAKGLNHVGACFDAGRFCATEVARALGMYADIENCYLLAYVCQKPEPHE